MLFSVSCVDLDSEDSELRQQLIDEGVEIRISEFRTREWAKCVENARAKAIASADSIIRARAKHEAVEQIIKPPKPDRPAQPPVKTLPDSLRPDTLIREMQ